MLWLCFTPFLAENLPAPELKKLRNKQRKAQKKKAEQENAQSKENQKKEQHNKKQLYQDGDPEAPQLDELIPEKLARPDDPLEKAIEFLKPLQLLAKDNIETHLMAFEIYLRRNKLLLMLQSLKRARKIDATNAILHSCIVRFYRVLGASQQTRSHISRVPAVYCRQHSKALLLLRLPCSTTQKTCTADEFSHCFYVFFAVRLPPGSRGLPSVGFI